jgi:tetratricopeptide (TPR) repeat protein
MDEQLNQAPVTGAKRAGIFDAVSFGVILGAIFLLPLFFLPSATFPFQFGKAFLAIAATVVSAILWIISRLRSGSLVYPRHPLFLASIGVLFATFLSVIFSVDVTQAIVGGGAETTTFGFLAIMFALMFVVFSYSRSRDKIFYTYLALFASFVVLTVFHLARLVFGADFLTFGIFTSAISNTVGKWNDLGIIFGLGTVLSLVTLELANLNKYMKWVLYGVLAFSLYFLILVNFISIWMIIAILSLTLFIFEFEFARRSGESDRSKMMPIAPLVVFLVALIFIIPLGKDANQSWRFVGNVVNDRLAKAHGILHLEVRPTWSSTYEVGKKALWQDPVFGAGPNQFTREWLLFKPAVVNGTAFWNADFNYGIGLLPTIFVTTGILGIISWILFITVLLYTGFRAILTPIADAFSRYLVISSFFSALFLWIFMFLYVPSAVPTVLTFVFTGIFLGALAEAGIMKTKDMIFVENPRAGFATVLGLVFALVLSVVTGYVYTSKWNGASAFQKGMVAFNVKGDAVGAEAYFKQAASSGESDTYYRFLTDLTLIKINTLLAQPADQVNKDLAQQDLLRLFGEAKQYAETAVARSETNYQNWLSLGRVYEALVPLKVAGAYDQAVKAYDEALVRNPHSPEIYLTKARLEVANGQNQKARELIGKALTEKNNYTEAVFFLSQIEVAEGNLKQAISSVEASIFLSPNEPVLYFQLGLLKYNTKDYAGAVQALEQAKRLNASYANARYFLGLSYEKLKNRAAAIEEFKEIAKLNPTNTEVKQIITNLEAGRAPFTNASATPEPEKRKDLPVTDTKDEVKPTE